MFGFIPGSSITREMNAAAETNQQARAKAGNTHFFLSHNAVMTSAKGCHVILKQSTIDRSVMSPPLMRLTLPLSAMDSAGVEGHEKAQRASAAAEMRANDDAGIDSAHEVTTLMVTK